MEIKAEYRSPKESVALSSAQLTDLPSFPANGKNVVDAILFLDSVTTLLPESVNSFLLGFRPLVISLDGDDNPHILSEHDCDLMSHDLRHYSTPTLALLALMAWMNSVVNTCLYYLDGCVEKKPSLGLKQLTSLFFYARILRDCKRFIDAAARHRYGVSLHFV